MTPLRERLGLDQTQKGQSVLMIREAVRADHGNFTIHVENTHGVASASCIVNVLGKRTGFILSLFCRFSNFLCDNRFSVLIILRQIISTFDSTCMCS